MKRLEIKSVLKLTVNDQSISVSGWVRAFRSRRFIHLNDGSTINNLQIITDNIDNNLLEDVTVGACLKIIGKLTISAGKEQDVEINAEKIEILGKCDATTYPIQPKKHSLEFLRENAHLRWRTNTFGAVFRIRHHLAYAVHQFFHGNGFFYIHTPIITSSDCEGAGEMFQVTTLDLKNLPLTEDDNVDYSKDFFGKPTSLTVSGQLQAEVGALSLGKVYTFAPTFRAENSHTSRHLSEFWMIEPEVAFNELPENMDLGESFLKYTIRHVLEHCKADLIFLADRLDKEEKQKKEHLRRKVGLIEELEAIVSESFARISYTEAIEILTKSSYHRKKKFQFPIEWGIDLQSEHERYLVEKHFEKPVIVTDYPKEIKAFYMKLNPDKRTVAAMDILFPIVGEIIGGSQREESELILRKRMKDAGVEEKEVWWYLELRKFGSAPHSGFGLGFERLVQFVTGMSNIKDVIPFPRTPKSAMF